MAKITATPVLTVDLQVTDSAGKVQSIEVKEGDIVKDLVFTKNGVTLTKTGKITQVMTATARGVANYAECVLNLKSLFASSCVIDGFVVDSSTPYGADVNLVLVKDMKSVGEIVPGSAKVDLTDYTPGAVQAAIAALVPGQALELGSGEITEDISVPAGVTIKGANAGVSAATGYRAAANVEGETIISGNLVSSGNITLDGVTLSGKAVPRISGEADVNLTNCRFENFTTGSSKEYLIKATSDYSDPVKVDIQNCYFGPSEGTKIYNALEFNVILQADSIIKGNYFARGSYTNNAVNIYEVEDNAYINVCNNIFEVSGNTNAVRVGVRGDKTLTVNLVANTFDVQNPGQYEGFMLIQPWGKSTTSMKNITVNMNNTTTVPADARLWYYYSGSGDAALDVENRPKVFINGVLDSYEGKEYVYTPPTPTPTPEVTA